MNCSHCSYKGSILSREEQLTTTDIISIIQNLSENLNIVELQFLGGEPLLRSDYQSIINYAIQKTIPVSIITNGFLIDDNFINFIKEKPIKQIVFSIDGINEESYGKMRKQGIFNEIIQNLDRVIKTKHPCTKIKVHYVLTKVNLKKPQEIVDFFQDHDIDILSFNFLEMKGNALKNKDILYVTPEEYFEFLEDLYKNYYNYKIPVIPPSFPIIIEYFNKKYNLDLPIPYRGCPAVTSEFLILSDGTFVPCASLYSLENIRELLGLEDYSLINTHIENIYNKSSIKRIVEQKNNIAYNKHVPCNKCKYLGNYCQPCFIEGLQDLEQINPLCVIAHTKIQEYDNTITKSENLYS